MDEGVLLEGFTALLIAGTSSLSRLVAISSGRGEP